MFKEAWRLQRDHFWAEDMSGVDWWLVLDRYLPLVGKVATRIEFSDLMWEMQGELGTSHAYELGGDYRPAPAYVLGMLGAETCASKAGGGRSATSSRATPGRTGRTRPLNAPGINVHEGDTLLAVGGRAVGRDVHPNALLVNQQGMAVQTLYRTSGDSPIVDALIDAAEAGKQVLALVEIKARFDEQANISWARKLEQAGVHVVYGIVGLKTHCKLSLVVRQEVDGLRRYCHIGTGNYHPRTARYYEDLGLLTANEQVGEDLSKLFNQLSGYAPKSTFKRLLVAPRSVRSGLIDRIETEIRNARAGIAARVQIKVNSMVDEAIIDSLYRASQAGVPVDVIVRGICSLRPGVPGLSENITVRSVLGRFLEHSRVFAFANGGDPVVYIGSADMMHRNLDRRVEALVQLTQRRRHELRPGLARPLHGSGNRQLAPGQPGRMDPPPPRAKTARTSRTSSPGCSPPARASARQACGRGSGVEQRCTGCGPDRPPRRGDCRHRGGRPAVARQFGKQGRA